MVESQFAVGDKIKVNNNASKHHTKVGIVKKVGKARLTVKFENTMGNRFVEIRFAEKATDKKPLGDVEQILGNLAVTVGTLIARTEKDGEDRNVTISRLMLEFKINVGRTIQEYRDIVLTDSNN